jgi:thiamine biosynthesis protein ThiI
MEKVVHLLSAGIDSPVAGYLLVKSGFEPIFLTGDAQPYATDITKNTAIRHARKVASYAGRPLEMFVAPTGPIYKAMQTSWNESELKYTCIFCKRMLYRVAREIAIKEHAQAISSGEIIGEQASQTIDNLALIQQAIGSFLIIRPLLTWDKIDVMKLAREIGTLDISNSAKDPCKAVPRYPITHGKIDNYAAIEAKIDVPGLLKAIVAGLQPIGITPGGE